MKAVARAAVAVFCVLVAPAAAQDRAPPIFTSVITDLPGLSEGADDDCAAAVHGPPAARGRAIARLSAAACLGRLDRDGVPYEPWSASADGIATPVRVVGPIAGVELVGADRGPMDCRLALAIAAWAPELRAAGIRRLRAVSIHRPGARVRGSERVSGHAHGLALDLGSVELDDGTAVSILDGWEARTPGADPCGSHEEGPASSRLRAAVCAAVRSDLFQVVLTPHHDRSHQNHLHLELVPGVDWSYVH
jgi:hypothetical protein